MSTTQGTCYPPPTRGEGNRRPIRNLWTGKIASWEFAMTTFSWISKFSWIRQVFARPVTRPIRKSPRRVRLAVEELEPRWCPSSIVVNNPTDTPVTGETDLRQAIVQANGMGGATITFDSNVFATPQTISLARTPLTLTDTTGTTGTTTITGPAAGVTLDNSPFVINAGVTAVLSNLTISGCTDVDNQGGGVANYGTLTMTDCTVSNNDSRYNGGGVYNDGTLTMTDCTISGNGAGTNTKDQASTGGAMFNLGTASLYNSTVSDNYAYATKGGIATSGRHSR